MRDAKRRGFSLVEVLVATACAVLLGIVLAGLTHAMALWSARVAGTTRAQASLDRLLERWDTESATAWSVFAPATDIFGQSNADGHELDLATVDSRRRPSFRAYYYKAGTRQLVEYAYGSRGAPPVATGNTSESISAFEARTYPASALRDPASPFFDPLFATATIADAAVPLQLGPDALGGNRLTRVHITADRLDRMEMLASETAPSGFTIVMTYTPAP
jgi:hypothetical protein